MRTLSFLKDVYNTKPIRNFWLLDKHSIPDKPGSYIILARQGEMFEYPRKKSPVFYIGKAINLRKRLNQHFRFSRQAKIDRKLVLYWPLYEWAAVKGARYTFVECKSDEKARLLERDFLAQFAEKYRSWPIANGQGGWDSLPSI